MTTRPSLDGWEEFNEDGTGEKYYYNPKTKRTSWTHPKNQKQKVEVIPVVENRVDEIQPKQRNEQKKEEPKVQNEEKKEENLPKSKPTKYKPVNEYKASRSIQLAPLAKLLSKYAQVSK